MLENLEASAQQNALVSIENSNPQELRNILSQYRVVGFCMNRAFTETKAILQALYHSQIHTAGPNEFSSEGDASGGSSFAAAVYVSPLHGGVMSVWVYVASLTPMDGHRYSRSGGDR